MCGMDRRVLYGYPVGWDFTEFDDYFVLFNANLTQLCASLSVWGDGSDNYELVGDE